MYLIQYNRYIIDDDMVYSIDFLQIDFGLSCLSDNVDGLLFGSFDFEMVKYRAALECSSGVKHLAKYDLHWWQFGGLHVEVWPKSISRDIGVARPDEDGEYKSSYVKGSEVHWFLRLKFNPNKNADNPVLKLVFSFLYKCGWVNGWHFSRVDYALDIQGPIKNFYVLSRKAESYFDSTRYYGTRGTSGYLRVYDKRKEQREIAGEDIGFELTRFEWEQRGNRDFDFTFDQFSRMDISGLDGATRLMKFVPPEMVNQALLEFHANIRTKIRRKLFAPITPDVAIFRQLLDEYVKEYGLSGMRVFTDSQRFDFEQGNLSPAAI